MSVGVIGYTCDSLKVISVVKYCVGSVCEVIEHDGFFIILFIRGVGVILCCCAGIRLFLGCYEHDYFFVGWVCAGDGVMFILAEDLG